MRRNCRCRCTANSSAVQDDFLRIIIAFGVKCHMPTSLLLATPSLLTVRSDLGPSGTLLITSSLFKGGGGGSALRSIDVFLRLLILCSCSPGMGKFLEEKERRSRSVYTQTHTLTDRQFWELRRRGTAFLFSHPCQSVSVLVFQQKLVSFGQ